MVGCEVEVVLLQPAAPPRLQDHAVCLCAGTVRLSPVSGVIALDCCPRRSSEPPRCGLAFLLARAMWLFLGLVHWQ